MRRAGSGQPNGLELFCGAGGMTLGFRQAGVRVAGAVDGSDRALETHDLNFPDVPSLCADVIGLNGSEILASCNVPVGSVDVVFGGPPCQGFSVGGSMDPSDVRNQLLLEFARLVTEIGPSYFVVENVGGLLNERYAALIQEFERIVATADYTITKPIQILDAAQFGVPQRRRRVFLLGSRRGCAPLGYPKRWTELSRPSVWDAIGDLARATATCRRLGVDAFEGELGPAAAYAQIMRGERRDPLDRWPLRRRSPGLLSGFASTGHSPETVARFRMLKPGEQDRVSRFIRLRKTGICTTLRAGTGSDRGRFMAPRPVHPTSARCICLREAARLHSFPDWFEFPETKWHGFMQLGNSVPPRLARAVAIEVVAAFVATRAANGRRRSRA